MAENHMPFEKINETITFPSLCQLAIHQPICRETIDREKDASTPISPLKKFRVKKKKGERR
jgi:hypothetical protein